MDRKVCADCGSLSLDSESRCWACGGTYFFSADDAPAATRAGGERTMALGTGSHRTLSWPAARPAFSVHAIPPALLYVSGAFCFALFMCVLGFWVGKASTPEPELVSAGAAETAIAAAPMPLPSPPTGLQMATAPGPGSAPLSDSPVVSVQTRPGQAPVTPPGFVMPVTGSPAGGMAFPTHQRLPADAVAVARIPSSGTTSFGGPAPGPMPDIPAPGKHTAVVTLRNDTPVAVQVLIDGEDGRTAIVAPGATLPLVLSPGTYRLKASGGGISSVQSSLALAAERSYTLIVSRKQDGGKDTLVLIEPVLDSASG